MEQRTEGGGAGRGHRVRPQRQASRVDPRQKSGRGRFDIPLDAGDLPGEEEPRRSAPLQRGQEVPGRVDESVAVQAAVTHEHRIGQPRYQREDPFLLRVGHLGLEAHEVVKRSLVVFLSQLHHGVRSLAGSGIHEPGGPHRAERQGLPPAPGHLLDGEAAFEEPFEAAHRHLLRFHHRIHQPVIVGLGQGQIQVVAWPLVVARRPEGHRGVHGLRGEHRRDGVVVVEVFRAQKLSDALRKGLCRQRSRGQDGKAGRNVLQFPADQPQARQRRHLFGDGPGKARAIHRQGRARGHLVCLSQGDDQGAHAPHLFLQQPRPGGQGLGPKRVAAHELGEIAGGMGRGAGDRPHLVQVHRHSPPGELPRGLAAGETAADYVHTFDGFVHLDGGISSVDSQAQLRPGTRH